MTPSNAQSLRDAPQTSPLGRSLILFGSILAALTLIIYAPVIMRLWRNWNSDPDMSHGFFVPIISGVLLWLRRDCRPDSSDWRHMHWGTFVAGIGAIGLGAAVRAAGILYRSTTVEAWSLLPFLLGLVICSGGRRAVAWAWPSLMFLAFMLPIPQAAGGLLSSVLQRVATIASTYCLQLFAVPAVSQGNVIWLSYSNIGVAEACNGLRMLTSFCAMATAAYFILDRPWWQRLALLLSAPVIGIAANVVRITATGLAYEWGHARIAMALFHDLAGWLMIPVGLMLLAAELAILSRLLLPDEDAGPQRQFDNH